jgi:hypothetical protein
VPFDVATSEPRNLEVAAADGAGNLSAWVRVRDVEWVASLGGKQPGRQFPNPHRFELLSAFGPRLARSDGEEKGESDGLARADRIGPSLKGSASWVASNLPDGQPHYFAVSAWDDARARMVVWGGTPSSTEDLVGSIPGGPAEYDGHRYAYPGAFDPEGDGSPENRIGASLAYGTRRGGMVLFGGTRPGAVFRTYYKDCWLWNGFSWKRLPEGPPARSEAAFFYDSRRDRFVLLGGRYNSSSRALNDAWALEGSGWERIDAGLPPARYSAAVAWDDARGVAWLFGGIVDGGYANDLWKYDSSGWSQVDAGPGPGPRAKAKLAIDTLRGRAVMFGGVDSTRSPVSDPLWEWDGTQWTSIPVPDGGPTPRADHSLVFDPVHGRSILIGGEPQADVWGWNGSAWELLSVSRQSPPQWADLPRLACGPQETGCIATGSEVRMLDKFGWTAGPAAPISLAPAWDGFAGRFVAVGPAALNIPVDGGTFQFDMDAGWVELGIPTGQVYGPLLMTVRGGLILVPRTGEAQVLLKQGDGGWTPGTALPEGLNDSASTSLFDGGACASGGVSRAGTSVRATWQWVGGAWAALPDRTASFDRIAMDERRGRLVALGGLGAGLSASGKVLSLERNGWNELVFSDPELDGEPLPRVFPAATWNPLTERVLMGPGYDFAVPGVRGDAWELEVDRNRPAAIFHVALDPAQVPLAAELRGLTVSAVAGAHSEVNHVPTDGVRVGLFQTGRWRMLAPGNSAPPGAAAALELREADPVVLDSLLRSGAELHVALVPAGENGRDGSELAVDYVEVRIRYRLP